MIVGPRNYVLSLLLGEELPDPYTDQSEWVVFSWETYDWQEWPELWMNDIHDHVGEIGA